MNRIPLTSVITPSYRNSQWLPLCIASVADQGVEHEHIVQDAGSDDGTLDWLPRDSRVKAFVEQDSGMYDAVNRGLRRASGDILAYLNCDEQYLPGALASVHQYFSAHPEVEVVFGFTVATDRDGAYLFHRKVQAPKLYHTWTHPLSVLTCATFFRRSLLDERKIYFDPSFRICGDADWVLRLLRAGVRMGVLPEFTSCFANTGQNLSLDSRAQTESQRIFASAPRAARLLRPAILLHHRARRFVGGVYRQPPFAYSIYTQASPAARVTFSVTKPTARWKW